MELEQALQIFREYSSIFTVVEDVDVDKIYLADNFDRHGIFDYVFKIEHYQTAQANRRLVPFTVMFYRDRDFIAGGHILPKELVRLPDLDEPKLRKMIRRTIMEYSRLKLNLRRNLLEGL